MQIKDNNFRRLDLGYHMGMIDTLDCGCIDYFFMNLVMFVLEFMHNKVTKNRIMMKEY